MTLRIGNGAGFWGDNLDAPARLANAGRLDVLTLEYLAELTMSVLARKHEKDPAAGFADDFIEVLSSLAPVLRAQPELKIITNAGGVNPLSCAAAAAHVLQSGGLGNELIGVVAGDDLMPQLADLQRAGCLLANLDDRRPLVDLGARVVSANAYLGAREIAAALDAGARLIITGRVADASLSVAAAQHAFGWPWDDWHRLAGASVAGHLIECGAQATGGFYPHWNEIDLNTVGYPIAELSDDGTCVITKPAGSGGRVNRETVIEQLVYEIGDPAHYLTPDVDVDFTTVEVTETGPDRVRVSGATGRPATGTYKVSLAYQAGYTASGQLLVYGPDCVAKARACGEIVLARCRVAGWEFDDVKIELLGAGDAVPGLHSAPRELFEVVLRMAVRDEQREAVERFTREFAPLATAGPAGLAGYTTARGTVRPVFAYWPTLVPKDLVAPRWEVRPACKWSES